jgi:hypothetical protein
LLEIYYTLVSYADKNPILSIYVGDQNFQKYLFFNFAPGKKCWGTSAGAVTQCNYTLAPAPTPNLKNDVKHRHNSTVKT